MSESGIGDELGEGENLSGVGLEGAMAHDRGGRQRGATPGSVRSVGAIGLRLPTRQQSFIPEPVSDARESALVARIASVLKRTPQCWHRNIHGSAFNAGLPDLLGTLRGRSFAIECKRAGEKPTALQVRELISLREAGGEAVWVDSFEGFSAWWEGWKGTVRAFQP